MRGKRRAECRGCGGSGICKHGRRRATRRECGCSAICKHGKGRAHCNECTDFHCRIQECPRHRESFAGARSLLRHTQRKHGDHPKAQTKRKELVVYQALQRRPPSNSNTKYTYRSKLVGFLDQRRLVPISTSRDRARVGVPRRGMRRGAAHPLPSPLRRPPRLRRRRVDRLGLGAEAGSLALQPRCLQGRRDDKDGDYEAAPGAPRRRDPGAAGEPRGFTRHFLYYDRDDEHATLPTIGKEWSEAAREVSWNPS